ncbi:MAG: tRNA glutamyl-Q(34) synthetase GluQRS [Gammaproteobacteria bacterium]|nr:tRNA glutamyl-Q(34) synthetase GluQRS [Gammaproteobacteria bacterium]
MSYVGRFAPTPSGPLHFGSLVSALASYLDARANKGRWLVRIEDLDPPRTAPGSIDAILSCLHTFGLHWDGDVMLQSERQSAYLNALEILQSQKLIYACSCSRAQFQSNPQYLCTCLAHPPADKITAMRIALPQQEITVGDVILGPQTQQLALDVGDFVVQRKDRLFAYQLAVVVDDAAQGITHIVRGSDLYDQTPRQVWLQQCLGFPQPVYAHIPIIINNHGQKLSKQNLAQPLNLAHAPSLLSEALERLGQATPCNFRQAPVTEQLAWAVEQWDISAVPPRMQDPMAFV